EEMKRSLIGPLVAVLLVGVATRPANAWHDRGHMTVALIAYRQLEAPQQKKVQEILKEHPHFKEFLKACRPADAPADEWVVMRAAIWPDWVRHHHTDEGFSKPLHHYVNRPVKRLEGASEAQVKKIEANIAALEGKESAGLILTEFPK